MWVRYLGNKQDRTAMINAASLVINALIGIGKLILGIYLLSGWFVTNAVYYLILCVAKGQVLQQYKVAKRMESPKKDMHWSLRSISAEVFSFAFWVYPI